MQQVDWSELFDFLSGLSAQRFSVGIDQLNEVQHLLVELAVRSKIPQKHELAWLIAPIICRSPEEQRWFHSLFERWLQVTRDRTNTSPSIDLFTGKTESEGVARRRVPRSPSWYWIIALLLVISAGILTLLLRNSRRPPIVLSNNGQQFIRGKVITSDPTQPVNGATLSAQRAPLDETKRPAADAPIIANTVSGNDGSYTLRLSDSDFPIIVEVAYAGYDTGSRRVNKGDTASEINISLSKTVPRTWLGMAKVVGIALIIFICAFVLLLQTRQLHLRKWRTANRLQIDQLIVKASAEWLPQLLSLRRSSQNLRQRFETGLGDLDSENTVKSTIQSGLFTPVYKVSKSAPEYLVLINRRSAVDGVANFADEIVRQLIRNGVYIDRYYYDGDPRLCWNIDRIDRSFTLDDLSTIYPNHNLIIFDDGSTLFNPITGVLRQSFAAFGERPIRALLTHDFPLDEYRYQALSASDMLILPANAKGIAGLAELASGGFWQIPSREGELHSLPAVLRERPARWIDELAPPNDTVDQLCYELKTFLGADAYLWLASCAVYPQLQWDLALYLGYELLDSDDVAKYLPQIFRLPWFRRGTMPDWLRERLISDLREREEGVRDSLYQLLGKSLNNDDGLVLDIARRKKFTEEGFWHASWHNLRQGATRWTERLFVRDFLRSEPSDSLLRDHVFKSFMFKTGRSKLVFRIPRDLRDAFVHSASNDQVTLILYSIMSALFLGELATSIYAGSLFAGIGTLIAAFLFFYGDKQSTASETKVMGPRVSQNNFKAVRSYAALGAHREKPKTPYHWSTIFRLRSFDDGLALISYFLIAITFIPELALATYRQSIVEVLIIGLVSTLFIFGVRQITNPYSTLASLRGSTYIDETPPPRIISQLWLKARSHFTPRPPEFEMELSGRAIVVGMLVALIIGSSYPYCVLKLGFGPNLSVVSAFAGFVLLVPLVYIFRLVDTNPRENNIIQTIGTSAGQTAFMAVLLAAFDMLNTRGTFNPPIHLGTWQIFFWLCSASLLGILLAVPMRRHYIDEENLTYADGLAAGETIRVLHAGRETGVSIGPVKALAVGTFASAVVMTATTLKWVRENWFFPGMEPMRVGLNVSLLGFGSGLLVGFRICLAIGMGTLISWVILPPFLMRHGMITALDFPSTLRWVMWPATGLMVAGGLVSLALKWNLIVKTFRGLRGSTIGQNEFPMKYVVIGSIVMTVIICLVQYFSMGIPVYLSFIAIVLSLPLMLVGLRVLGETNWGPISAMSNMMQAIFAFISPGNVPVNMSSSGLTGTIAVTSEALMQDFKTGQLLKSNPRSLTIAQLIAAPVGSMATAVVYPILRNKFGIGDAGLSSPISVKWAGFAELLTKGLKALPPGCLVGLAIGIAIGILLTLLAEKWGELIPSPSAMGIGMLITPSVIITFVLGGIVQLIWARTSPQTEKDFRVPLASGLIAGEALLAVIFAILAAVGVNF